MPGRVSWIDSFFGGKEDFYGTVYTELGVFDRKDTEREIEGTLNLLKPEPGSHILDWCGGWGRHAIPFAKRGFKVTVLDFSAEYLERAKAYARKEGVEIATAHFDFRHTPSSIQADYAVNLFTAGLGYLGEENDVIALKALSSALRPSARVLIDTMSLFWIARNFRESDWDGTPDGKKRYLQKRVVDFWTNTEKTLDTYQDIDAGTEETRTTELKLYCPADLSRVLTMAGFVPQKLVGDLDGSDFSFHSERLVMTAERP